MALYFAALLALDRFASSGEQLLLGVATAGVLVAVARTLPPELRAQVAVVVVVATCFEILGSVIWGVYGYRLGNLPLFVPPAHGLVYLTGVALSRTTAVRQFPRAFVASVVAAAVVWGAAGLTVLPRLDIVGAFGIVVFCVFLLRCAAPTVLGGVFFAVAALELYGTAVGAWTWAEYVPGLGVPNGNPPSGAVSGYVLFDLAAMAFAPRILAAHRSRARAKRDLLAVGHYRAEAASGP